MSQPESSDDLAALMGRLYPRLMAAEEPILSAAGISMWEYAILSELSAGITVSQVELSRRTGRDTTRLGKHIADLEAKGLVIRQRGDDARQRTVRVTDEGSKVHATTKESIRHAEDALLSHTLSAREALELRRLLSRITEQH